jgi:peptide/nickel transport system substrate-binding protein
LEDDPDVVPLVGGAGTTQTVPFNHHEDAGWSANRLFRQAVQARLDYEEVALTAFGGDEDLYDLNPSIYRRAQDDWWTDVAADTYNQNDPERARELLEESGYDGEEIIFLYVAGDSLSVATVTVLSDQLEDIGINITTEGVDGPTMINRRAQPDSWHLQTDGMSLRFTPADWDATLNCETFRSNWCDDEMQAAFDQLQVTVGQEEQKPLSDEIQRVYHENVYALHLFDHFDLVAHRENIKGFEHWYLPRFWGVWREE